MEGTRQMAKHEPITLLHISDTQFRDNHHAKDVLKHITEDLDKLGENFALHPKVVVLTGDLTQTGSKDEFDQVLEFANELINRFEINKKNFAIIPGNHDVNWSVYELAPKWIHKWTPKGFRKFISRIPEEPYGLKWEIFAEFFKKFYCDNKGNPLHTFTMEAPKQPWTLFKMPEFKLVIVGLNSTINETNLEHYGYIGEKQLLWFEKKLGEPTNVGWFSIAVLHHNIRSDSVVGANALKDRNNFFNYLDNKVNLILHGHTHNGQHELTPNGVHILATGSAGVNEGGRSREIPNQYQIIQILPTRYRRWCRAYRPSEERWIGDTSVHKNGNDWRCVTPVTFYNVDGAFQIESTDENPFLDVEDFLETGDVVTAINLILKGKPLSSSTHIEAQRLCLIYKQKYGFYKETDKSILKDIINVPQKGKPYSDTFNLLYIKILSQEQEFDQVIQLGEDIQCSLDKVQLSGLLRRKAVAKAITLGELDYFNKCDDSTSKPNRLVTTETLKVIAQYFCVNDKKEKKNVNQLAEILARNQIAYIAQKAEKKDLQICRYKSALQALFAEAAILIEHEKHSGYGHRGWTRLIAAHLLVRRIMIRPSAEGYSELLSMIYCEKHFNKIGDHKSLRNLIEKAMLTDHHGREKFMAVAIKEHPEATLLFYHLAGVFEMVPNSIPTPEDWGNLQDFLKGIDDKLGI